MKCQAEMRNEEASTASSLWHVATLTVQHLNSELPVVVRLAPTTKRGQENSERRRLQRVNESLCPFSRTEEQRARRREWNRIHQQASR